MGPAEPSVTTDDAVLGVMGGGDRGRAGDCSGHLDRGRKLPAAVGCSDGSGVGAADDGDGCDANEDWVLVRTSCLNAATGEVAKARRLDEATGLMGPGDMGETGTKSGDAQQLGGSTAGS
jgi:hypothetical protein